jgi:hypothetical protein
MPSAGGGRPEENRFVIRIGLDNPWTADLNSGTGPANRERAPVRICQPRDVIQQFSSLIRTFELLRG